MKNIALCIVWIASLLAIGCGDFDEDPCTYEKNEKVTVTAAFEGLTDYFMIRPTCSENSILKESSITVYLVIKDDKIYTKKGDKITLKIIEKTQDFPLLKHAYYAKVVSHTDRF